MNKKWTIVQMILFAIFGFIVPIVFIGWRYNIFTKIDKVSLNGWGLLALIIMVAFIFYVANSAKAIMANEHSWSFTLQAMSGLLKVVLPLATIYIVLQCVKTNIDLFQQAVLVTTISESIAVLVNPFPRLKVESVMNGKEKEMNMFVGKLTDAFGGKGGNK